MTNDRVLQQVRAIVTHIAGPSRVPPNIDPDTPLGEGGFWLDSVDVLEVMIACEQAFGVSFDGRLVCSRKPSAPFGPSATRF